MRRVYPVFALSFIVSILIVNVPVQAQIAHDPGPRTGTAGAGKPLGGLTGPELNLFNAGIAEFKKRDEVKADGLGPRMNLDSCAGCHSYPDVGGTSPPDLNPQFDFFERNLKNTNKLPRFVTRDGPVREARFKLNPDHKTPDGGVHSIFTITGLRDADGCVLQQPDFARELRRNNVIFRIPTPAFGGGLIEQIPDQVILDNHATKRGNPYGVGGRVNIINAGHALTARENRNGNDGTIARFGWKAQNKSLLVFAGEAYNVEMGISNELFQTEREEDPRCQFKPTPNDTTKPDQVGLDVLSDIEKFAAFMRFLAPPTPSQDEPGGAASLSRGKKLFVETGCALCHTPSLRTGTSAVAALSAKDVDLYSDLALHDMGDGLADGISQGQATSREFRTAPLWGLGQRIFFLHDGRTGDLKRAIQEHRSSGSEANKVVRKFFSQLSQSEQQDILNFLRSL
jgi:CxxC motif-containing protein (DUF1111 family)